MAEQENTLLGCEESVPTVKLASENSGKAAKAAVKKSSWWLDKENTSTGYEEAGPMVN